MSDPAALVDQLRATLGKLEVALSAVNDAIVWTNASGRIQWCNIPFAALVGRRHLDVLGERVVDVLPLMERGRPLKSEEHPVNVVLESRVAVSREYEFLRGGSPLALEVHAAVVTLSAQDSSSILTIRDVTERKRGEDSVAAARAAAEAYSKELETFSYSVAHDLRAPLRSMDGFSSQLLLRYADKLDAEGQDFLRRVRAGCVRMGRLIDDLLALSRVTRMPMRRERVDLSSLARETAEALRKTFPERVVEFAAADGLCVEGDESFLRLAVENLIGNAWKYTGRHASAKIEFGASESAGRRVYFVRDDGAGFDMAFAGKLFKPFSRLHTMKEFEGSGVGLATVERIVGRHGGRIWGEAEVEKGAAFYFTLWEEGHGQENPAGRG
ncbi:MAG: PAS domain-containing protein [Elusimicrobia bacterium]|nr:PAS domain-containing protein [Elusimicrobiota bacterium]